MRDPLSIVEGRYSAPSEIYRMKNQKNIAGRVAELISPVAAEQGIWLWDVEFVREGARQILRVTIDSQNGINIDDCERFHRAIDPLLDEADPIDAQYYLEVSSPGVERELKRDEHFAACAGWEVEVKLYAPDAAGKKVYAGELRGLRDGRIILDAGDGEFEIERSAAAKVKTVYDFDNR